MANLRNALKELHVERSRAQVQVEKLDQAISVIESLNGAGGSRPTSSRVVSAVARRRMARAQRARWAKLRRQPQSVGNASAGAPKKRLSVAARKKIAAAQRARWARVRAQEKKAA